MNNTTFMAKLPPRPTMLSIWSVIQSVTLAICILVYILNGFMFALYLRHRHLRTPFSVYLLTVTGGNLLNAVFNNPLLFVLRDATITGNGTTFCMVYLYLKQTVGTALPAFHMLIALNRIWAMCYPLSYRQRHTRGFAGGVCVVTWMVIHAVIVPGLTMEGLYFRTPGNNFLCTFSTGDARMEAWSVTVTVVLSIVPEVTILCFYPFAVGKRVQRSRKVREMTIVAPSVHGTGKLATDDDAAGTVRAAKRSFTVLTLLTVSATVCWTPTNVYFVAMKYFNSFLFMQIAVTLKLLHTAIDPLLFMVSLQDLRRAARNALCLSAV
ncbi:gastrin/cholecystokinin type B receptor-like [Paramacrobiotus metropolitanus]|uniref:gastrin/cholecystokinin type B receptor-like n=1 Tax=Paramacrobiotus metropolitanus TaxID=2943436 RepID=UPI002445CD39|nr:gastrin/cholecystokinin type B receptor-like [Paramacrobiotus metropolitanus]